MEIVTGERALYSGKEGALIVSDLHIGFEEELGRNGILFPDPVPGLLSKISSLLSEKKAKRLIILGDVKHSFSNPTFSEEGKVVSFLKGIGKIAKVEIVPGNHDGGLENVLPIRNVRINPPSGIFLGKEKALLFHGHSWPDPTLAKKAGLFVLSHVHPTVALVDSLGKFHKTPCFISGKVDSEKAGLGKKNAKAIIIPAFNSSLGGALFQDLDFSRGFFSAIDRESAEAILPDGTIIGTVRQSGAKRGKTK